MPIFGDPDGPIFEGWTLLAALAAQTDRRPLCAGIGRNPAEITRSVVLPASYHRPDDTRQAVRALLDGGFSHFVLSLTAPYPAQAARWVADMFIGPFTGVS